MFRSLILLSVAIFFSKIFFCKHLQELPQVVLQKQQKIDFLQKRISAAIRAKNPEQRKYLTKINNL